MIGNLKEQSKIMVLISDFSSVAESLENILRGDNPQTMREKEILRTTGDLFRHIDWGSEDYCSPNSNPRLVVLATELRPLFYEHMKSLGIYLGDRRYFEGVYNLLNSSGQENSFDSERLGKTIELFRSVTKSLRCKLSPGNI